MSILKKLFGDANQKEVNKFRPIVLGINDLEKKISSLSDEKVKLRIQKISEAVTKEIDAIPKGTEKNDKKIKINAILKDHLQEVFALTREVSKRRLSMRHFDVQLIGSGVLNDGKIAEMKTGEGKTLVATSAVALNALTKLGVHVVTVNDYLSKRDAGWMGPIYHGLGLSVGVIVHEEAFLYDETYEDENALDEKTKHMRPVKRREAYEADITYGTNNEFGFDYLRDNMVQNLDQMVQRDLNYAIVDEVDSILIDEARTPLIISAQAEESTSKYFQFAELANKLKEGKDYIIDEKQRAATLTDEGIAVMERMLGMENIYEEGGIDTVHHIEQSLKAVALFKKDKDYVVRDGEVVIVDEFTGRMMPGRRYSEGLHQAIEAKEGVEIKRESLTLATISFQNYFRLYTKLAGMTGTAETEAEEFHKIYKLDVVVIPTNMPNVRKDYNDLIFKTEIAKFKAIVEDVKERNKIGQPVLIGTISIEKNEILSQMLKINGVKHAVLNAKFHEKEAMIISKAGEKGAVTVATNMAGRGTDIVLEKGVQKIGGLHVIGSERHEARRIDNQLRGRSARQGDPGSTQFYVSLEDDLMRVFGSDRIGKVMSTLGLPDDQSIQNSMISKSLESAQRRVEGHNFDIRKHLVDYDDVMNKQREYVYAKRRLAISQENLKNEILIYFKETTEDLVEQNINVQTQEFDYQNFIKILGSIVPLEKTFSQEISASDPEDIIETTARLIEDLYEQKEKELGNDLMRVMERAIYLRTIDMLWIDHLDAIDNLREGIGLRGYGQMDPLVEYKKESYRMFQQFLGGLKSEIVNIFFKVSITPQQASAEEETQLTKAAKNATTEGPAKTESRRTDGAAIMQKEAQGQYEKNKTIIKNDKVGRNDPCPCGAVDPKTNKPYKYKKCGLINAPYHRG